MTRSWQRLGMFAAWLLVVAVALAAVWGHERTLRDGHLVLLELAPVDPRSLMQGDYMALRFAVDLQLHQADGWPDEEGVAPRFAWLVLDQQQRGRLQAVADELPDTEALLAMRIRRQDGGYSVGPNAFFFQEGTAERYEAARWGGFRVRADGTALLQALYDAELELIGSNQR